jgi:hypothetical protein
LLAFLRGLIDWREFKASGRLLTRPVTLERISAEIEWEHDRDSLRRLLARLVHSRRFTYTTTPGRHKPVYVFEFANTPSGDCPGREKEPRPGSERTRTPSEEGVSESGEAEVVRGENEPPVRGLSGEAGRVSGEGQAAKPHKEPDASIEPGERVRGLEGEVNHPSGEGTKGSSATALLRGEPLETTEPALTVASFEAKMRRIEQKEAARVNGGDGEIVVTPEMVRAAFGDEDRAAMESRP